MTEYNGRPIPEWMRIDNNAIPNERRKRRIVIQLKDGKEVARYYSVNDAARAMGITPPTVSKYLKNSSRIIDGYEWMYG